MIVNKPKQVLPLLEKLRNYKREHLLAVLLTKEKTVIKVLDMTTHSHKHFAVINRRNFWSKILLNKADGLILAHNHPCESLYPSEEDKNLTSELIKGGEILGVQILDHLIITSDNYFSFAENNIFNN